jgi:hypothetical protein
VELNAVVVFTLRQKPPQPIKQQAVWNAETSGHVLEDEHLISPAPGM